MASENILKVLVFGTLTVKSATDILKLLILKF